MTLKKLKLTVLAVLAIALVLAVGVFAAENELRIEHVYSDTLELGQDTVYSDVNSNRAYVLDGFDKSMIDSLAEMIYNAISNVEPKLNVYALKIPSSQRAVVSAVWKEVDRLHREIEWYNDGMSYVYETSGYVKEVTFKYAYDGVKYEDASIPYIKETVSRVNAELDRIVDMTEGMSELEAALFVHDYLCLIGEYDYSYGAVNGRSSYDIRGILLNGTGVCQSYTWIFQTVMQRLDIPCVSAISDEMDHTWNQVCIDGLWYNMDVTWDDPKTGFGNVKHEHVLCSNYDFLYNKEHNNYYSDVSSLVSYKVDCSSQKYDNAFWLDVETYIPYANDRFYYIDYQLESNIYSIDLDTWDMKPLVNVSGVWYVNDYDNRRYVKNFTRLVAYGDRLYYNDAKRIYSISLDGGDWTVVRDFFDTAPSFNIYGLILRGDVLSYAMSNDLSLPLRESGTLELGLPAEKEIIKLKSDAALIKYLKGYRDGTFKPEQAATRYEVVEGLSKLFDINVVPVDSGLTDVDPKYKQYVDLFTSAGIIDGFPDGTFRGEQGITRAQFCKIISVMMGLDIENPPASTFLDISDSTINWAEPYINACAAEGYIIGKSAERFDPRSLIKRSELATLINRVRGSVPGSICHYPDVLPDKWYYGEVAAAAEWIFSETDNE